MNQYKITKKFYNFQLLLLFYKVIDYQSAVYYFYCILQFNKNYKFIINILNFTI